MKALISSDSCPHTFRRWNPTSSSSGPDDDDGWARNLLELWGASRLEATDDDAEQELPGPRRVESGGEGTSCSGASTSSSASEVWHAASSAVLSTGEAAAATATATSESFFPLSSSPDSKGALALSAAKGTSGTSDPLLLPLCTAGLSESALSGAAGFGSKSIFLSLSGTEGFGFKSIFLSQSNLIGSALMLAGGFTHAFRLGL
mmetsp:Transcript_5502/g.11990  ORF Transcript_5502/g.11990 Transcript_5502/m.11990 type:complete len:204 (+) Transcript_5502:2530-3141(+)